MDPLEKDAKLALLRAVPPEGRILLLPHCLRRSAHCRAHYTRESGLQCEACDADCPVNRIVQAARVRNFGGICVAPGGSMAVTFLKEHRLPAILAVACPKELTMGVEAVVNLSRNGWTPLVITLDLTRDGCVDTEVDVDLVVEFINI
jgi:geranylgeranyl diphosphate synthase, type II